MKIVSEQQLNYIKTEYKDLLEKQSSNYVFDGSDKAIFDNLILFTDDRVFTKIREDHYLSMTNCQRVWNEYFWYLRYVSDITKNVGNVDKHQQSLFKVLEKLYNTCDSINDNYVETFINFTTNFEKQDYITFDYSNPAITETGVSLKSQELSEIVKILNIQNFSFDEVDELIEKNIDNANADLLTFKSSEKDETVLRIDTFSASEDQIHPIEILINCRFELKEEIDKLLVSWWTRYWRKMGPFVSISTVDKFDNEKYIEHRKRIEK